MRSTSRPARVCGSFYDTRRGTRLSLSGPAGELGESDGPYPVEVVGAAPEDGERTLQLVVRGRPGVSIPYSLTLETPDAAWCPPDAYEGPTGNDDDAHASLITDPFVGTVLCPDEEDWFAIDAAAGTVLTVLATPAGGADGAEMLLRVPGVGDEQAEVVGDDLVAEVTLDAPARVLIALSHAGGDAPVQVTLFSAAEVSGDAQAVACAAADELVSGEPLPLAPALQVERLSVSCGEPGGADHVAAFDLAAPTMVSLRLLDARGVMGLELRRDDCGDATPPTACAAGDGDVEIEDIELAAGRWFVVVEGGDAVQPALLLTARKVCAGDGECAPGVCAGGLCQDPCAVDDDCPGAQTCAAERCVEPDPCGEDVDCFGLRVCEVGDCFLPECQEHGDCLDEGDICEDRRCIAGEVGCEADPDCPASLLCEPPGGAPAAEPCAGDDDCSAPTPLCFVAAGRCVGCLDDADCLAAEVCFEERCADFGDCEDDADCPGSRTCGDEGECVPAECPGDRLDDALEPPMLDARTYTALLLCDGDQDRYAVEVPAAEGVSVVLQHEPDEGDLSLALAQLGELVPLTTSDGTDGFEVVGVDDDDDEARVFEVQVSGRSGASVPYTLSILRTAGTCAPDAHEGLPDNDEAARATRVGLGDLSTMVCPCDVDWFDPELPVGAIVTATATPTAIGAGEAPGPEALTLQLVGPDGPLDVGEAEEGSLVASATVEEAGAHRVRLAAADGQTRVAAQVRLEAIAAENADVLACGDAAELVRGEALRLPAHAAVPRFELDCQVGLAGGGGDHVVHFLLDQPAEVTIQVSGALLTEIREQCPDGAFVWCDTPQEGVAVEDFPLEAGDHWLVVQGLPGVAPEIQLDY